MYAKYSPAPFLSVVIHDCIEKGRDYYDGGPRYNTNYIQCCGIGTVTDSLSAIKTHVFDTAPRYHGQLLAALAANFQGAEALRLNCGTKPRSSATTTTAPTTSCSGSTTSSVAAIDGKPNTKGTVYHLNMLSTTCHVYFGKMLGASANGRLAHLPESDGTSPSHGADRNGPTAVIKSLSKMDQIKSGGTLLNQRFLPSVLATEQDLDKLGGLIRTYFTLGGHHIQFNVVDTATLRRPRTSGRIPQPAGAGGRLQRLFRRSRPKSSGTPGRDHQPNRTGKFLPEKMAVGFDFPTHPACLDLKKDVGGHLGEIGRIKIPICFHDLVYAVIHKISTDYRRSRWCLAQVACTSTKDTGWLHALPGICRRSRIACTLTGFGKSPVEKEGNTAENQQGKNSHAGTAAPEHGAKKHAADGPAEKTTHQATAESTPSGRCSRRTTCRSFARA
jgi:hypothetical protein